MGWCLGPEGNFRMSVMEEDSMSHLVRRLESAYPLTKEEELIHEIEVGLSEFAESYLRSIRK